MDKEDAPTNDFVSTALSKTRSLSEVHSQKATSLIRGVSWGRKISRRLVDHRQQGWRTCELLIHPSMTHSVSAESKAFFKSRKKKKLGNSQIELFYLRAVLVYIESIDFFVL
ncbi:hypothetical protein RB195_008542 [Necator americanus]|uniref:Uncharacterized protein n=1 Tax=Necator americanus TaxID=51031 RepID=A0ABR1CP58_NECAM